MKKRIDQLILLFLNGRLINFQQSIQYPQPSTNDWTMNTALWVMQSFLASVFLVTGLLKLLQPADKVRRLVPAVFPLPFVRLLAGLEVAAAVGILLPWLLQRLPVLTPLTACGMSGVLLGAALVHSRQREWSKLPFIATLLVICLVVAYLRFAELS